FSVPILRILMGGVFIFFLTQPVSWFLVILRSQKFLPRVYLISAVLNLVLNLVFIPIYSFYAAAVITLVTELVIFTMLCFYSYKAWNSRENKDNSALQKAYV
ncbi:MAG TPA: polysaccharide biosynthesis C-terminal domain-containing protein, partial [bacterium]|nr:polysaccharide biosynthesis C-terminal domain-containing protein [bacterium]